MGTDTVQDTPTRDDLDLREATVSVIEETDGSGPVDSDGNVHMHIIRPGLGRGRGRHLYEAKMLETNAHKFAGWRMYLNHLSPEAKKAKGGLPRDVQDLGGRIVESWWDPTVPAVPGRFGQGAVVAKAKPTPFVRALIENDPEVIEASISATATGVRPGSENGQRCWIVEGIEDRGSVDWVTEAGAGGRVVSLMEAAYAEDGDGIQAAFASMTDEEFRGFIAEHRPDLVESLSSTPTSAATPGAQEDDMTPITPESLREALEDEDTRDALLEALDVDSYVAGLVHALVQNSLPTLVEAAVEAERDVIRATAKADADRRVFLAEWQAKAHKMIDEARLPDVLAEQSKAKFSLVEGEPQPALDVVDKLDDEGKTEKKADDVLTENVEAEIAAQKAVAGALRPARVRGQGPSAQTKDGDPEKVEESRNGKQTSSLLQEAGFGDTDPWAIDSAKALQG